MTCVRRYSGRRVISFKALSVKHVLRCWSMWFVCKRFRRAWLVSAPSSASRPSSSRSDSAQSRFSATRSRSTSSDLFEDDDGRAKAVGKVGRILMEILQHLYFQDYGHETGDYLMTAVKFVGCIQSFSDLSRTVRTVKDYRRMTSGMSRDRLPLVTAAAMMGVVMMTKDEEFAVMLTVQYVTYLRPIGLCKLTTGQVNRPLQGSGTSSWTLLLAPQEELKASKTVEFDEGFLLDDHLSIALDKALTRYTAGKTTATRL